MEGVAFIVVVFGGGMLMLLSRTTIGQAIADRIRGHHAAPDPALQEEVERMRHELTELQERVDFAERMLAQRREPDQIAPGGGH